MLNIKHSFTIIILILAMLSLTTYGLNSKTANHDLEHGKRYSQLVIRNVTVINGSGTPARGGQDVVIKGNTIHSVTSFDKDTKYKDAEKVIDGTGQYLLPGLINLHGHIHEERGGKPIPFEYIYKLWLSCGITTVRDVMSNEDLTIKEREKSRKGQIAAPRIYLYMAAWGDTPAKVRERVREIKRKGGDGMKIFGNDRDTLEALLDEAKKQGLRVAHHIGVEETDVRDDIRIGVTTSIEHWYGIPDAALEGSQRFPFNYDYHNETHRFRYAGHLWREADKKKLKKVLKGMVNAGIAWDPTFVIYEANRDLQRAMNQPWFKDYLHPALAYFFTTKPGHHGSYFKNWSTTDELFWKENYRIWMKAVWKFANLGGIVGVGEDAGFIYMMYGFSLLRELELHQEAGFHPIDVIQQATGNNARIMGLENKLGRIKTGYLADMILMDENPLTNLKFLYPTGVMDVDKDYKSFIRGGIKWTIKDGIVYDSRKLLEDVKTIVSEARKK
ncbi:MAG: amidohydrolase family protein [bacterium]|nr:amidohydrolase family protein [bacterium]